MELEFHAIPETTASRIFPKRPGAVQVVLILRGPLDAGESGRHSGLVRRGERRNGFRIQMPLAAGAL